MYAAPKHLLSHLYVTIRHLSEVSMKTRELHAEREVLYLKLKCRVTKKITTMSLCLPESNCWQQW